MLDTGPCTKDPVSNASDSGNKNIALRTDIDRKDKITHKHGLRIANLKTRSLEDILTKLDNESKDILFLGDFKSPFKPT